jgi:hypothetical protein
LNSSNQRLKAVIAGGQDQRKNYDQPGNGKALHLVSC